MRGTTVFLLVIGLFACRREEPKPFAAPRPDTVRSVVDSIFPAEEEIRRFKAARTDASAIALTGGAASRDALVRRFIAAVEARDIAALRAMALSPAEFIDLYYPSSAYAKPPYKQSPELVWLLLQQNSEKGIRRVIERHKDQIASFRSYDCAAQPVTQGKNRLWNACRVRWEPDAGAPKTTTLFGAIVERDGRYKFVSYANDL